MAHSSKLRDLILNTRVPLILEQFPLEWECFDGSLHDWCDWFDHEASDPPTFELMSLADTRTPQWERKRTRATHLSMQQFLREYGVLEEDHTHWAAYQYKRAHEIPASCLKGIDFSCFGFPEHGNDFSLWLGSEQANTPCHYDTFGVNIVVQVFGCKSWLLFPPETPLQSTRVPYEESSVYCLDNFYAPDPEKMQHYEELGREAYHCNLQAGDVLVVPRHWWHYVEAMSTSLSVNYWVPLKVDMDLALDEFLVKHIVESFVKGENDEMKQYLLNPNQLNDISDKPSELFAQFEAAVQNMESGQSNRKLWETDYISQKNCESLLISISHSVRPLKVMPPEEYKLLLQNNSKRFQTASTPLEPTPISSTWELLVSSMCAPRVIAGMKREFFRRLRQSNTT
ncbi:lysine-specific demethylase 8 [Drosophila ficusphila]|uniref:lysine-specific demethylase 8 n=1 Tax=Drosophila ficusphila TaxID=30025 RepID=UPI0007E5DF9D|nr:lysine-specific demethylase 8 [Drosophila ficusphila]